MYVFASFACSLLTRKARYPNHKRYSFLSGWHILCYIRSYLSWLRAITDAHLVNGQISMCLAPSVRESVMLYRLKPAAYLCPIRWVQVAHGMALERWSWTCNSSSYLLAFASTYLMCRLDDEQAADLSQVLSSVSMIPIHIQLPDYWPQAFRSRLPEIIDQAHHFAALSSTSGAGHQTNDAARLFREGLDVTERESKDVLCRVIFSRFWHLSQFSRLHRTVRRRWRNGMKKAICTVINPSFHLLPDFSSVHERT